MSDLIRRDEAIQVINDLLDIYVPNESQYDSGAEDNCKKIIALIKSLPTAEPLVYVKKGTLTAQMPTIKEAKATEKIVVYADTYRQEYHKTKVGTWIDDEEYNTEYGYYFANCSECGYQIDVHENRGYHNYCPRCGAKMEGSE